MNRRAAVAAIVVVIAAAAGIIRSTTSDDQGAADPPPVATAPTATTVASPVATAGPASTNPAGSGTVAPEPVDEGAGAGETTPATGTGRDTGPGASTDTDRRAWEPVALGFSRAFTTVNDKDTATVWRSRLRPFITGAVDKQLATVDITNVPRDPFNRLDVLDASDEQATVQATYRPGWVLVLYLISDGNDHWKVYRYDRFAQ